MENTLLKAALLFIVGSCAAMLLERTMRDLVSLRKRRSLSADYMRFHAVSLIVRVVWILTCLVAMLYLIFTVF